VRIYVFDEQKEEERGESGSLRCSRKCMGGEKKVFKKKAGAVT